MKIGMLCLPCFCGPYGMRETCVRSKTKKSPIMSAALALKCLHEYQVVRDDDKWCAGESRGASLATPKGSGCQDQHGCLDHQRRRFKYRSGNTNTQRGSIKGTFKTCDREFAVDIMEAIACREGLKIATELHLECVELPVHGGLKSFSSYSKAFNSNCNNVNKVVRNFSSFSKRRPATCFYSNYVGNDEQCSSIDMINQSLYQSGCSFQVESRRLGTNNMVFVDSPSNSTGDVQLTDFISKTVESTEFRVSNNGVPNVPTSVSDSLNSLSGQKINFSDTINEGEKVLQKSYDTITSSMTSALTNVNKAVDNVVNDITSFINKSGESAGNKMIGLSSELKEGTGRAGFVALDVLRRTVIIVEDFLMLGAKNIGYAYDSAKEFLPREFQDALSLSEGRVIEVLRPFGTAFQQVYIVLEGFEESLGLDPNDPLIPFVLVLGNLRDRDGIPDLRRSTRYRYASVTLPEVDGSVKKLLKGGSDIEDSLLAAVIHDLKIVEDRSKVLVMDADGTRSKGVARSPRKLGTKARSEAILEEINPTPLKLIGYGVGVIAAAYCLVEWETTLQFIGIIGIGQTIYRRVASYQDAEDLKQDMRLLLAPVRLGGQAISWAAGKLETNRNGLPTSPSSSDVQSRVLQAAAKLESQPSDSKESQASGNEEVNMSEA
ncbi:hypothetical protein DH2020_013260 [Rehmannia glutinosa]|uniref:Uncharacterized protein n=1 Tax=Rehmannia glutinosa TaxID=99300 RepID=A0ABR0X209_REHGL